MLRKFTHVKLKQEHGIWTLELLSVLLQNQH